MFWLDTEVLYYTALRLPFVTLTLGPRYRCQRQNQLQMQ